MKREMDINQFKKSTVKMLEEEEENAGITHASLKKAYTSVLTLASLIPGTLPW